MPTLTPQQIADLKASIAKKYTVLTCGDANVDAWAVGYVHSWSCVNDNDHDDPLDAEAEMEAIIQDEVKAVMQEMSNEG